MSNKRKHTVKYLVLTVMCTMAMAIGAGTCDVSFEGYKNAVMTDFVVPLYLTEGQDGFSYQGIAAGGADLCVSDVTGGSVVTESLPYEIERWLPSGQSILWVRVPSFSAATVLRLSWGTDQISVPITTGVWRNMWTSLHMGTASNREEGPVGDAAILGNSVMTVNCPSDSVTYSDAFSISFWFKAQSPVKLGYISRIQNSKSGQFAVIYNFEANKIELYKNSAGAEGADPRPFSGIDVPDFDWHHYAYSYDGTTLSCYRDGRFVSASTVAFRLVTENKAGSIHIGGSTSGKDMPTGVLDEYRMSVEPLSLAEIQAMCELQSARYFDAGLDVSFPEFSGSGSLVDFTALVTLNDRVPGFEANAVMKAIDEGTFEIALADTKESLPIERECITTSGTVPELSFWVKIPSLDENTRLHLSWLKTGCSGRAKTDFPMRNVNVWPAESLLVWHMAAKNGGGRPIESVNGGALYPIDGYDKDPAMMDGPTGRYAAMRTAPGTGSSQGTIEVTGKSIDRVYTISFWARKDDFDNPQDGGYAFLMRKDVQRAVIAGYGEGNAFRLYGNGYSYGSSVLQIPDSGWHHYAFVADGNSLSGYCDGVCKFTGGNVLAFGVEELKDWTICLGSSNLAKDAFPGGLDEFRVDTVARSGDWIRTMYRNQLAYREGQSCLNAPGMLSEYSCSKGANAINYSVRMNSKQPSTVTFFYGASDHGEVASGWDHQVDLGTKDGFAVVESQVSGLASKDCLYGRFRAVNEYGTAWSRSIFGRTKTVGVSYGTRVKFPGYVGSSALKDFPVCIRLPASDLLPSTSDKVWVEARDGSSVPYEVETWNPASTSVIWVRVPLLTRGTSVFVRWADDGQPVAWPRSAVWDDKYVRVYHLGPDGKDSSVNAADVVSTGSSADAEGLAGRCRSFTGANGSMATLSRPFVKFGDGFTISLCAKFTGTVKPTYVWQTYGSQQLAMIFGFNGANVELFGDESSGGGAVKEKVRGLTLLPSGDDKWHHYAYAYDGQQLKTYKDGSLVGSTNLSYALGGKAPDMLDYDFAIGGERSGNNVLNGSLDEICVERVGRSEDWIGACGANMANTLCTIGPYEEISLPYGMVITIR